MKSPENMTAEELKELEARIKKLRKKKGDKLYLITRNGTVNYDEYEGFVIRASSAKEARAMAAEKDIVFLDAHSTSCERIKESGDAEILLESFHAG